MLENIKHKFENFRPYINGSDEMKRAAVLIPIIKKNDSYEILFELRSKKLRAQPSEISFPGGKIEPGEAPIKAAIRETCEELGTYKENIEIISEMDLYVNHTNLIIHPYLGIINDISDLNINEDEVETVFTVPLDYLLSYTPEYFDNTVRVEVNEDFPYDKVPNKKDYKFSVGHYSVVFYEYKGFIIWGITAKILENFLNYLKK